MSIIARIRTALYVFAVAGGLATSVVPQAAHASDEVCSFVPRKTDVAVSVVGHSGNITNDHLDVAFNLTDEYHDASVQLKGHCNYRKLYDQAAPPRTEEKLASMTLYASTQVPIPYLVTCVPFAGESVSLTANVMNGDSNIGNNSAAWDPITGK